MGERGCRNAGFLPTNLGKAEYKTIELPLRLFAADHVRGFSTDELIGTFVENTARHSHAAFCLCMYRATSELF